MQPQSLLPIVKNTYITRRNRAIGTAAFAVFRGSNLPGARVQRPIFSFEISLQGYAEGFFERLYRMPKRSFYSLATRILLHRARQGRRTGYSSPLVRLSCAIRWLAGGSYLDISMAHHLPVSTTYLFINKTIDDLDAILTIEFPVGDKEALSDISVGFSRDGRSPLSGCCGALD